MQCSFSISPTTDEGSGSSSMGYIPAFSEQGVTWHQYQDIDLTIDMIGS